jgi:23S rRNA pseudouridine1911/1915/1917 synthase
MGQPLSGRSTAPERVVVGGRRPRDAVTHFEVIERIDSDALLSLRLETGRTHQIRAHMQAIGHPICGDRSYGGRRRHGLERQFLHSSRLAFRHPDRDEWLEFESELPGDLAAALEAARG